MVMVAVAVVVGGRLGFGLLADIATSLSSWAEGVTERNSESELNSNASGDEVVFISQRKNQFTAVVRSVRWLFV
ncbi:hypothetical protein BZA05DRAFT_405197, partial [Tricharina praecox]|uniref:uncharacterized protein n=1 Tax=Tricharina praecox TaxID=43433 RepID=UPI0022208B5B